MNRVDLIVRVSQRLGISRDDARAAVQGMFDEIIRALQWGDRIEFRDFGVFTPRQRKQWRCRNPRTGKLAGIADKVAVHFKPGRDLRDRVNRSRDRER